MKKKPIEIYWAPANFTTREQQWNFFYGEPEMVYRNLSDNVKSKRLTKCPAFKHTSKNLFQIKAQIDDKHTFPEDLLSEAEQSSDANMTLNTDGKIALLKARSSNIEDHINIVYNLSWYFISPEPLKARFTAPYFPNTSPTKNSLLAYGEFDIGQWFRAFNLDYHIPLDSTTFEIAEGDPLAFIEFETERPIVFKRFNLTEYIHNLLMESPTSVNLEPYIPLVQRYRRTKNSNFRELLISEIRKNLGQ